VTIRRSALMLAAVLAATVLTGGAAILGIARAPHVAAAPQAPAVQTQTPAPSFGEEGD